MLADFSEKRSNLEKVNIKNILNFGMVIGVAFVIQALIPVMIVNVFNIINFLAMATKALCFFVLIGFFSRSIFLKATKNIIELQLYLAYSWPARNFGIVFALGLSFILNCGVVFLFAVDFVFDDFIFEMRRTKFMSSVLENWKKAKIPTPDPEAGESNVLLPSERKSNEQEEFPFVQKVVKKEVTISRYTFCCRFLNLLELNKGSLPRGLTAGKYEEAYKDQIAFAKEVRAQCEKRGNFQPNSVQMGKFLDTQVKGNLVPGIVLGDKKGFVRGNTMEMGALPYKGLDNKPGVDYGPFNFKSHALVLDKQRSSNQFFKMGNLVAEDIRFVYRQSYEISFESDGAFFENTVNAEKSFFMEKNEILPSGSWCLAFLFNKDNGEDPMNRISGVVVDKEFSWEELVDANKQGDIKLSGETTCYGKRCSVRIQTKLGGVMNRAEFISGDTFNLK